MSIEMQNQIRALQAELEVLRPTAPISSRRSTVWSTSALASARRK